MPLLPMPVRLRLRSPFVCSCTQKCFRSCDAIAFCLSCCFWSNFYITGESPWLFSQRNKIWSHSTRLKCITTVVASEQQHLPSPASTICVHRYFTYYIHLSAISAISNYPLIRCRGGDFRSTGTLLVGMAVVELAHSHIASSSFAWTWAACCRGLGGFRFVLSDVVSPKTFAA